MHNYIHTYLTANDKEIPVGTSVGMISETNDMDIQNQSDIGIKERISIQQKIDPIVDNTSKNSIYKIGAYKYIYM
jgi:hypothetical protein